MLKNRFIFISAFFFLMITLLLLGGCMKPIPYNPDQVTAFHAQTGNISLEFVTDRGRQVAFYIPPINTPEQPPARINILYPGINSVALGWQRYIPPRGDPDVAYLLIDYPGRGLSEGSMRPDKNYLNTEGALKALSNKFGGVKITAELSLLGHSFGAGAALQFADRTTVARIVLVAPFNDLKAAAALQSWFLSVIMPLQIDNREIIRKLLQTEPTPQITILHGTLDKTLPVTMGRELAAIAPEQINFYEFADDDHVGILTNRRDLIFDILHGNFTYLKGQDSNVE